MRCIEYLCHKYHGKIRDYIWLGIFIGNWNFHMDKSRVMLRGDLVWFSYIFQFLADGKKLSSERESLSSMPHNKENIDNHNKSSSASDFFENNLTIALCPKAELDDDCKYFSHGQHKFPLYIILKTTPLSWMYKWFYIIF